MDALAAVAQGVEAALCLVLQYRHAPHGRWTLAGPVWRKPGVPHSSVLLRSGAARALLRVSDQRRAFTLAARHAFRDDSKALVFVLHFGAVDANVSNLNLARDSNLEVHALAALPLYEPHHPMYRVRAARAPEVAAFCGLPCGGFPVVGPLSPEVVFTGAKEGDLVEVVQPTGVSFFLVAPREAAQPRRRLLLSLRRAKSAWRRRADGIAAAKAAACDHCRRQPHDLPAVKDWTLGLGDLPPQLAERLRPLAAQLDWTRLAEAVAAGLSASRAPALLLNGGVSDSSSTSSSSSESQADSQCDALAEEHEHDDAGLAALAARLAARLARDAVDPPLEDRLELRHRLQHWRQLAADWTRPAHDFWAHLRARHGLPVEIANALRATDPEAADLHDQLAALSAWL
jgi:hypothetical protein